MKPQPLPSLSIIICTLNEEHYLPMLLDSLQHQSMQDFELIIADAGSEDQTTAIAARYESFFKDRFTCLTPGRIGLSKQRNVATQEAKAEIFLFLDADVVLPTDFLAKSLAEFSEKKCAMAGTKIYAAEKKRSYKIVYFLYSLIYLPVVRIFNPILHGCSLFCTRTLFQQIGGFTPDITFEDFKFAKDGSKITSNHLLKSTFVYTSARRYYHFKWRDYGELILSGIVSIFKAGFDGKWMKNFHANYGRHDKPRYE